MKDINKIEIEGTITSAKLNRHGEGTAQITVKTNTEETVPDGHAVRIGTDHSLRIIRNCNIAEEFEKLAAGRRMHAEGSLTGNEKAVSVRSFKVLTE